MGWSLIQLPSWSLELFLDYPKDPLRLISGGRDSKHGGYSKLTTLVRDKLVCPWSLEIFPDYPVDPLRKLSGFRNSKHGSYCKLTMLVRDKPPSGPLVSFLPPALTFLTVLELMKGRVGSFFLPSPSRTTN